MVRLNLSASVVHLFKFFFKPQQSFTTSSILTETALSRHEQSETIVMLPGPGKPQNKITATHRLVLWLFLLLFLFFSGKNLMTKVESDMVYM